MQTQPHLLPRPALPALRGMGLAEHWLDLVLAVGVGTLTASMMTVAVESGTKEPDGVAYALAAAIGATFLLRRRSPLAVLLSVMGVAFVYYLLNYPGGPPQPAFWLALFFVALDGGRNIALVLGMGVSLGAVTYRALVEGDSLLHPSMIADVALTFGAVMFGDAVHARGLWMAEVRERLDRADREREEEARRRVEQERLRIAHELHDILAHTLAAVNVQAGVASDLLDHDPAATRAALDEMRRASREAMTELRATVGVLRNGDAAPRAPIAGVRDLDRLIDGLRQGGLEVTKEMRGEPRPLSPHVDLAAFRVLQEALTNVVKHAAARSARVTLRYEPAGLALEVADDGSGVAGRAPEGYGITGMRERVEALGGTFEVGPAPGGGFLVRARLPDPAA